MGSTFVEFRDRGFEANNATLEVWLMLLVQEIDAMDSVPDWLREVREDWYIEATAEFASGVMPDLDSIVTSDERHQVILNLSRQGLKKLESHEPVITAEELNALNRGREGSYFTRDLPLSVFLRPARYFVKLLEGSLEPWESDARFEPEPGR
jgi:hypothetical protein